MAWSCKIETCLWNQTMIEQSVRCFPFENSWKANKTECNRIKSRCSRRVEAAAVCVLGWHLLHPTVSEFDCTSVGIRPASETSPGRNTTSYRSTDLPGADRCLRVGTATEIATVPPINLLNQTFRFAIYLFHNPSNITPIKLLNYALPCFCAHVIHWFLTLWNLKKFCRNCRCFSPLLLWTWRQLTRFSPPRHVCVFKRRWRGETSNWRWHALMTT